MYEQGDLNHLLRMAIADALRALRPALTARTQACEKILQDALNDRFSIENINIVCPEEEEIYDENPNIEITKASTRRGSVELKIINNCGPYAYLRWWDGKIRRSKYLGKVKGETS